MSDSEEGDWLGDQWLSVADLDYLRDRLVRFDSLSVSPSVQALIERRWPDLIPKLLGRTGRDHNSAMRLPARCSRVER